MKPSQLLRAVTHGRPDRLVPFDSPAEWLNSEALTEADLLGHVVLVDFWTYSCVNWLRTLPYLRAWSAKYREQGLVTIGVHSPEFPFEHDVDNVRRAARDLMVDYPVVIDNDFAIWRAFDNNYWPALYFIDAQGHLRHDHFGEGEYETSERTIQRLLTEAGATGVSDALAAADASGAEAAADWASLESPETYVGHARASDFASPGGVVPDQRHAYEVPERLQLNHWALSGDWTVGAESAVSSTAHDRIAYRFHARDVNLVMGPGEPNTQVRFNVRIDGQHPAAAHGLDVDDDGNGTITTPRMYQLIRQPGPVRECTFEIEFLDPGAATYVFTFG
jgi:thiol-disulfide isomerase/thioredoxin